MAFPCARICTFLLLVLALFVLNCTANKELMKNEKKQQELHNQTENNTQRISGSHDQVQSADVENVLHKLHEPTLVSLEPGLNVPQTIARADELIAEVAGSAQIASNTEDLSKINAHIKRSAVSSKRLETQIQKAQKANHVSELNRAKQYKTLKSKQKEQQKRIEASLKRRIEAMEPKVAKKGREKLQWMYRKQNQSNNSIIYLSSSQYHRYIVEGPRLYWSLVTLTAKRPEYNCALCLTFNHVRNEVAPGYLQHNETFQDANDASVDGEQRMESETKDSPVFFVEVDIHNARELFVALNLKSAPVVFLQPPSVFSSSPKVADSFKAIPSKYMFRPKSLDVSAADLHEFLTKHVHRHIQEDNVNLAAAAASALVNLALKVFENMCLPLFTLIRTMSSLDENMAFLIAAVIMLILSIGLFLWIYLELFKRHIDQSLQYRVRFFVERRYLELTLIVCGMSGFCMAGGMYNILRSTMPYGGHPGNYQYIAGAGDQFWIETAIIGALNLSLALTLVAALETAAHTSTVDDDRVQLLPMRVLAFFARIIRLLRPIVLLAIAIFLWWSLSGIYTRHKNPHFNYGFVWRYGSMKDVMEPCVTFFSPIFKHIWKHVAVLRFNIALLTEKILPSFWWSIL